MKPDDKRAGRRMNISRNEDGAQVSLDGVFLLEFADGVHCRTLREWWHRDEGPGA